MNNKVTVAVTGAAGQLGYALLFRLASGQLFGPNTRVELRLLELPQALTALEGVKMELEDCAFPLLEKVVCTDDVNEAMEGVNWAFLVGSVPRKPGMERSDLLKINGGIFIAQGRAISENAAPDVRVFVVGNPCNTNCLIAMHQASNVPHDRFYAMTMLDELRARMQLAKKAGVDITEVSRMTIWGNHSATQYPDFYSAMIGSRKATEVITDDAWLKDTFVKTVQQRGAAILKARGLSSAASAANAVIQGVSNLVYDTPAHESFSMACCSKGEYGVDKGLIFSFPCRVKSGKLEVIEGIPLNSYAQEQFDVTLNELRQEKEMVKEMGLLDSE